MNIIKRGEIFALTYGEYSDHSIYGVFRAEEDIELDEAVSKFPLDENGRAYLPDLASHVAKSPDLTLLLVKEVHLGSYGTIKVEIEESL